MAAARPSTGWSAMATSMCCRSPARGTCPAGWSNCSAPTDLAPMANELDKAVRRLCLAFPEAEEISSHGAANFRVRGGKIFATYSVNHHGDGRIALWLRAPEGMQRACVDADPKL